MHSAVRLVNNLPVSLALWLHQPNLSGFAAAGTRQQRIGPIEPGGDAYVPLSPARGGLLFIQPQGCERADKDVILLEPAMLHKQQGLISCRMQGGLSAGTFCCCLQVQISCCFFKFFYCRSALLAD